ncbi:MAG: mechanosensitive ion channel [Thiovulaceae bacterium]|nr:mechanosensitive ion channel [Sulfurimonadaceae bacterium]
MRLNNSRLFLALLLLQMSLWASPDAAQVDSNSSEDDQVAQELLIETSINENERLLREKTVQNIAEYKSELQNVNELLTKDSIWDKSYSSHLAYAQVRDDLAELQAELKKRSSKRQKSADDKEKLEELNSKEKILSQQFDLLGRQEGKSIFAALLQPQEIEEMPVLSNPLDIFSGISFIKHLEDISADYNKRGLELKEVISLLEKKREIFNNLESLHESGRYDEEIAEINRRLDKFTNADEILEITANIYNKRIDEIEIKVNRQIEVQVYKLSKIGLTILFLFGFSFFLKMMGKKYITDNDRFYMTNKIINFSNFILIMIILLFSYIENVSYLVTVLGFASAGIAIAMKDWFMSMLGWLVIVFGGSIHVGDRIRVDMDGMKYVGDVMDISLLRMTILEDITLTSIRENRRAGRIIFVPNNFVFTRMIASYSHDSLKTVWDGIDVTITFDSNHKKAMQLAKETARKYSKGYTDITRKQLNKLRHKYSLKNTTVEPRVYSFIEAYGLSVSVWYLTNAYATLTLRSTISGEIIDLFNKEDDITIAYPTQQLNLTMNKRTLPESSENTEADS